MKLTDKVNLLVAKVEILKLKGDQGGYNWAHLDVKTVESLEKALIDIDKLTEEVENA